MLPVNVTCTWDNNGNLINDGTALYRFDQANRLISTTLNSATSLYAYNGDGVRLKQIVAGTVTTYTQDLAALLPVVLQSRTGVTTTKYLYATGTRPLAQNATVWEYLLPDGLGSVRQIANTSGNIIRTQDYEPYGSPLNGSGNGNSVFGFTGEQIDSQTGLLFLRARYMQPKLGIFLAHDPWSGDVLRPGSINGFNYADGNPVMYSDPSGHFVCFAGPVGLLICVVGGIAILLSGGCTSEPAPALLPTSGAEPPYEPDKWNDGSGMQALNNCYSYAADDFELHKSPGPQPGVAGGLNVVMDIPINCSNLVWRMKIDGFVEHDCDTACNVGTYKVMVFVWEEANRIGDYHVYRQDQGGYWSHKPGKTRVSNLDGDGTQGNKITDPRTANRVIGDANYATPCGCFCVKRGTKTQTYEPNPEGP